MSYRTLLADPAWAFDDALGTRGAAHNYGVSAIESIMRFPLPEMAPEGSRLFLWRVAAMQSEALEVMDAWGYRLVSEVVWVKLTTAAGAKAARSVRSCGEHEHPSELFPNRAIANVRRCDACLELVMTAYRRLNFGMGRTFRMSHEVCLVGVKGKPGEVLNKSTRSVFYAPYTRHSAKPRIFHNIIESLSPGPYRELFARERRWGWTCSGDECSPEPERIKAAA